MQKLLSRVNLRELRLALIGIGAVITVATVAGFLVPQVKLIRSANAEVRFLERASQDSEQLGRLLQEQHARIEALKHRLHGDMAKLPVRQMESYIIGRLQRVSWNNKIELVSVEPASGERIQVFQEILFNVQLVGQYTDLYQWLNEMRDELGFVVVKEYSLTRHNNDDQRPLLMARLSLASYRAVR